jgi:hypothetical protein
MARMVRQRDPHAGRVVATRGRISIAGILHDDSLPTGFDFLEQGQREISFRPFKHSP